MGGPLIGVLALQGAFAEHQRCLEAVGCRTVQVKTTKELEGLDGLVLPGGESTAMGLIGTGSGFSNGNVKNLWEGLKEFSATKPTWGTCAGMILLSEQCVGASAVIEDGQALVGGMDILVCRNYFGSQVSSFEMATPPPPNATTSETYPGVFIRAPAILSAGKGVKVLGKVVATPSRQAAVVLEELERKLANGENVVMMGVVDALERKSNQEIGYKTVIKKPTTEGNDPAAEESKSVVLPGAADGTNAREVICAVQHDNLLCTAFHPELTDDYRWHKYFAEMVVKSLSS